MPDIDDFTLESTYRYWHDCGFDSGFDEGYDLGYCDGWNAAQQSIGGDADGGEGDGEARQDA